MQYSAEIQEVIFDNYEEIRNELIKLYDKAVDSKRKNNALFESDITKQYLEAVQNYVTKFVTNRTVFSVENVKLYVEDKFTFDNVERIISEEGNI